MSSVVLVSRRIWVVAVTVFLPDPSVSAMKIEFRMVFPRSISALLCSLGLCRLDRKWPLAAFALDRPTILVRHDVYRCGFLRHFDLLVVVSESHLTIRRQEAREASAIVWERLPRANCGRETEARVVQRALLGRRRSISRRTVSQTRCLSSCTVKRRRRYCRRRVRFRHVEHRQSYATTRLRETVISANDVLRMRRHHVDGTYKRGVGVAREPVGPST